MTKKFRICLILVLFAALTVVATILLQYCVIYKPIPFQQTKFDALIDYTDSNTPSMGIAIQLPPRYVGMSMTGKAYVTGDETFIPAWIGRTTFLPSWLSDDTDCEGYLFVKQNLVYDEPAGDMDQVTIYIPRFSGLHGIDKPRGAVKAVMFVRKKMAAYWYELESPPKSTLD